MPLRLLRPWSASVLALVGALGCASQARESVALYDRGDFAGAARAADAGLAGHPDDEALWQMRIRAALAQGDAPAVGKAYAAYRARIDGDDDKPLLRELAIATLGQALASPSVKLKIAAIDAVAAAELQALAEKVAERMGDDDDRVVAAAAVAVIHGYPQAPQAAGDMLHSEDAEARRIAVDGIGQKVGKLAIADLEAAAADPDAKVRRTAIRWLGQLRDTAAAEALVKAVRDPDETVRAAAATALARLGPVVDLVAIAKTALADHALSVRLAAVSLLAAARTPDAHAALTALTDDADPLVAAEAAIALAGGAAGAAGPSPAAQKAIDRAAASADWTVRAAAANLAVRALGKAAALTLAHKLAADPATSVRLAAARVLDHSGDPASAIPIFAAALDNADYRVSAAIDLALEDDPRGINALDTSVGDASRPPAARAAAATAHETAHRITPGLVAALADDSGTVRVAAAAAIAMLAKHD